jgi:F-type H+-transporting ATPase subunit b
MKTLIAPFVNVIILVCFLIYYCRKPLREFVKSRHSFIRDELQRVAEQLRLAQTQYDEFSAKLKAMETEIGQLRQLAQQDGDAMKLKILNDGRRVSGAVVTQARAAAASLFDDLKDEITRELSARVLVRAEAILQQRLQPEDRVQLRKEFVNNMEKLS